MNENLNQYLNSLFDECKSFSWSQPADIVLTAVLVKKLGYTNFTEIGTWLGATPIMLKKLETYFKSDQLIDFVLVDNLQDHLKESSIAFELGIIDNSKLESFIKYHIPTVNITIHNDVTQIVNSIDIIHFDSVKDHKNLIYQFDLLKRYYKPTTLFIFDDYTAEWPDIIYGTNLIADYNNLEQVAAIGQKVYLCSPDFKKHILNLINSDRELLQIFEIRSTFKHNLVIGSNYTN